MGVMDLMDKAETAPWEKAIQEEMLEKLGDGTPPDRAGD